jgi:hypothetical protein
VRAVADYYAELRGSRYYQPALTPEQAVDLGFTIVWSDRTWILWRVPSPGSG